MTDADRDIFETVDKALRALPDPALPPGLRAQVMRVPSAPVQEPWSLAALVRAFWPQAIGLAAASIVGVVTGLTNPGLISGTETDLTPYILAMDNPALPSVTEESME